MSNEAQSMEQHRHGARFVDDDGRCLACVVAVQHAELLVVTRMLERKQAALELMSHHAEEQNLLMPLHEQRQIAEALA